MFTWNLSKLRVTYWFNYYLIKSLGLSVPYLEYLNLFKWFKYKIILNLGKNLVTSSLEIYYLIIDVL